MSKLALDGLVLAMVVGAGHGMASAAAGQGSPGTPCPWKIDAANGTQVRLGDVNATYWRANFSEPAGSSKVLVLIGEYPHARYFSIYGYDQDGQVVDGLFDQEIGPDPGSANPFPARRRPGPDPPQLHAAAQVHPAADHARAEHHLPG